MPARRRSIAGILGAVVVVVTGTAPGQSPVARAPGASPPPPQARVIARTPAGSHTLNGLPAQVFVDAAASGGQPGAPDPAEARKQEHLQKVRQLTFDRRPSAILKAWATPREEAIKEAESGGPPPGM